MRKGVCASGNDPWATEVEINNKIVKFPTEIRNYVIYDDKVIISLSWNYLKEECAQENPGRNIWCYKDDGTLLWKIEESPHWLEWLERQSPEEKQKIFARGNHHQYYDYMLYHLDTIYVFVGRGSTYRLDPETGKVSHYVRDNGTLMSELLFEKDGLHKIFNRNAIFMKVYKGNKNLLQDNFAISKYDIKGLTAEQIKQKFALEYTPTHYIELTASNLTKSIKDVDTRCRDFIAKEALPKFGEKGGGTLFFYGFKTKHEIKSHEEIWGRIKRYFKIKQKIPKKGMKWENY
jgi:outer membrane protein assembly factor BamB